MILTVDIHNRTYPTNGDMIKALFNKVPIGVSLDVSATDNSMTFKTDSDWWNATYYIGEGNMDNKYTVYTESEDDFLKSIEDSVKEENLNNKNKVAKPKFKVYREVSGKTDTFEIGDRIKIKINGEKHFATAIQQKGDMTLFILDDCLDEAKSMKCEGELCYEGSEVRKFLRDCKVSKKYRDHFVPAKEWYGTELPWNPWLEDKLFLLSVNQICGWDDSTELINWFKNNYKNRIATIQGEYTYWWIRVRNYAYDFHCAVRDNGSITDNCSPEDCFGVRPTFVLKTGGNNK